MRIQPWAQAAPRHGMSERTRASTAMGRRRFMSIESSRVRVRELPEAANDAPEAGAAGNSVRRAGSGLGSRRLRAALPWTWPGRADGVLIRRMGGQGAHHKTYAHAEGVGPAGDG